MSLRGYRRMPAEATIDPSSQGRLDRGRIMDDVLSDIGGDSPFTGSTGDTHTLVRWDRPRAAVVLNAAVARQDSPTRVPRGLGSKALARAQAYMEQNIGHNFTLDQLARAACVSRAHFARLFRVSTGSTPMAYLLKLRMERAKLLLRRQLRVSDVAAALGFCDQSHFSRVFRRTTGQTPREYARQAD